MMRGHIRTTPTAAPESIGAELIREGRAIEREKTLLKVRREIKDIKTTKPSGGYGVTDRTADAAQTDALAIIDRLLSEEWS